MSKVNILKEVIGKIQAKYKIHAILLFGSRARGDYMPWSDYDLLIIGEFKERYLERIGNLLELVKELSIEIEPHPYTFKEALNMLKKGNPIIIDAIEEGKLLYKDDKFDKLLEEYEKLKRRGLTRSDTSIVLPQQENDEEF
ncbi:MAG TPA: nucleotidyltransferase domain-containing protein [Thermofilum sp.]|nr:nucleotidyltransferase domain-containing protein [Thermofilum sp.]